MPTLRNPRTGFVRQLRSDGDEAAAVAAGGAVLQVGAGSADGQSLVIGGLVYQIGGVIFEITDEDALDLAGGEPNGGGAAATVFC